MLEQLKQSEESANEKGWITADEVEKDLGIKE